jgi:hypothetical protein
MKKVLGRLEADVLSSRAAFATMALTLFLIGTTTLIKGVGPLLYIVNHYTELISAAVVMSFAQVSRVGLPKERTADSCSFRPSSSSR